MGSNGKLTNEYAPCTICNKPLNMSRTQRRRHRKGDGVVHLEKCLGILRARNGRRWHAKASQEAVQRGKLDVFVQCRHCGTRFEPSEKVRQRHESGDSQYYFCHGCVRHARKYTLERKEVQRPVLPEDAAHEAFRAVYFALQAKGALPIVNVYRRAW